VWRRVCRRFSGTLGLGFRLRRGRYRCGFVLTLSLRLSRSVWRLFHRLGRAEKRGGQHVGHQLGLQRAGDGIVVDVNVQPVHHVEMRVGKQLFHGRVADLRHHIAGHEAGEICLRGELRHIGQRGGWRRLIWAGRLLYRRWCGHLHRLCVGCGYRFRCRPGLGLAARPAVEKTVLSRHAYHPSQPSQHRHLCAAPPLWKCGPGCQTGRSVV